VPSAASPKRGSSRGGSDADAFLSSSRPSCPSLVTRHWPPAFRLDWFAPKREGKGSGRAEDDDNDNDNDDMQGGAQLQLPYDVYVTIASKLAETATRQECVDYSLVCKAFRQGFQVRIRNMKSDHAWDVWGENRDETMEEAERKFEELVDSLEPRQGLEGYEADDILYEAYQSSSDGIDKEWLDWRVTAAGREFFKLYCSFCQRCFHYFVKHEVYWYKRACVPTNLYSACANCREIPEVMDAVAGEEHL